MEEQTSRDHDWDYIREKVIKGHKNKYERYNATRSSREFFIAKEVDRYIECFKDLTHFWYQGSQHATDDELSEIIIELTSGAYDNGLNRHSLNMIHSEYSILEMPRLIIHNSHENTLTPENDKDSVRRITELLDERDDQYNPMKKCSDIPQIFRKNPGEKNLDPIINAIDHNQKTYDDLLSEKDLAYKYGANSVYYLRVYQYEYFSYILISEAIYYIFFTIGAKYPVFLDKMNAIAEQLNLQEENFLRQNNLYTSDFTLETFDGWETPVLQVMELMLALQKVWDDETRIEQALEKDVEGDMSFFESLPSRKCIKSSYAAYTNEKDLIKDLTNRDRVATEDYKKCRDAMTFIEKWSEEEGPIGPPKRTLILRIIYREVFMNKAKLPITKFPETEPQKKKVDAQPYLWPVSL